MQGWLKGVNSSNVNLNWDMGSDGSPSNMFVARDVYGFVLHYYGDDFRNVNNIKQQFADAVTGNKFKPLYNGNIAGITVNLKLTGASTTFTPLFYAYTYDQLNRLTQMQTLNNMDSTNNSWNNAAVISDYKENIKYDANGNILNLFRCWCSALCRCCAL